MSVSLGKMTMVGPVPPPYPGAGPACHTEPLSSPATQPCDGEMIISHLAGEEIEAQKGQANCLKSHSKLSGRGGI